MTKPDMLDKQAMESARTYMGNVAWPTVLLATFVGLGYVTTITLAFTHSISLWLAAPVVMVLTYLSYTVLHESAHGSISGSSQSLRWLNEALGYMAAWILMIPLTAHRHEHLAHHRHTNEPDEDPDYCVGRMQNSPLAAMRAAAQIFSGQFSYYWNKRWDRAPLRHNVYFCLEVAAAILPRLALVAAGFWAESMVLFGVAWLAGLTVVMYLFAYLVHRPHKVPGRYVDTSTIIPPQPVHKLVTWLWMFQNYHSIHHLFPRVPFYCYVKLYSEIGAIMEQRGAPVYRLSVYGVEPMNSSQTFRPLRS
jgi:fatty acid desaturase